MNLQTTMTGAFEWGSLTAMSLPDLLEVPRAKLRKNVPKPQRISRVSSIKNQSTISQASLLSRIGKITSHHIIFLCKYSFKYTTFNLINGNKQ